MAAKRSAGILLYRRVEDRLEVLIAHMGGPYWASKDGGAWTIPKGEYDTGEDPLDAALREFAEEIGSELEAELIPLGDVKQAGGKVVTAWAAEGDIDPTAVRSNTFTMEWPPRSGRTREFPEIDRAEWASVDAARGKLVGAQSVFLDRLLERLRS